jgi:hypothetical protein
MSLCALSLTACSTLPTPKTTTGTNPASNYTLQSVTLPSFDPNKKDRAVVVCPSKNVVEKVDCADNAATFEGGKYDLGASIDSGARSGTYTNLSEANYNILINNSLAGNWVVQGDQATLTLTSLRGNFSGGSLRLPMKFMYTKK